MKVPSHKNPMDGEFVQLAEDILQAAIHPKSGAIFVAYADGRPSAGERLAISLTRSMDLGETWLSPVRVSSDDDRTAWLPGVAINASSEVGVAYLSADFAPGKRETLPVSLKLKTYVPKAGSLILKTERILDAFNYAWPGDYLVLLATGGEFHAVYAKSNYGEREPIPEESSGRKLMDVFFR